MIVEAIDVADEVQRRQENWLEIGAQLCSILILNSKLKYCYERIVVGALLIGGLL